MKDWIKNQIFDRSYIDLFSDYEEYHKKIETNKPIRAVEIAEWIKENSTVLDVGCGDGKNAEVIQKRKNAFITGCDIVDKAKNIVPVIINDLNKGLVVNQRYDYVVFCEVLEHLLRPHEVLISAAKIAKKGVIVSIPNSGYITFRLQLLLGIFPRQSFTHVHFWTLKDFIIFCEQIRLKVLEVKFNQSNGIKKVLKKYVP